MNDLPPRALSTPAYQQRPDYTIGFEPTRRRIRVAFNGEMVAGETVAAPADSVFVFEPGIRPRYCLPRAAVRVPLLPSDTKTYCPYKGRASYHALRVGDATLRDLVWFYSEPLPACAAIRDLV